MRFFYWGVEAGADVGVSVFAEKNLGVLYFYGLLRIVE